MECCGGGNSISDSLTSEQRELVDGADVTSTSGFVNAIHKLLQKTIYDSSAALRDTFRSLVTVMVIMVLCACARGYAADGTMTRAITMAGALGVFAVLLDDFQSILHLTLGAIEQTGTFGAGLFPVLSASVALTGSAGTATVMQAGSMIGFDLLIRLIEYVLAPAVCAYLAMAVVNTAVGGDYLGSIAELIRWLVTNTLKLTLTLFIAYLTISGSISSSIEQAALKTARFAVSGAVPVVGGIISDATESMLSGAVLIKNAVGVFGMLCVAAICVFPFIRTGICYLLFRIGAAVMSPICGKELGNLLKQIGDSIGLLLGMLGACSAILFFEMVLTITMVKGI